MILRFRNLGVIDQADIDISKPFIVFTGPNGTGKTYLSYVLSNLPRNMGGYFFSKSRNNGYKELSQFYDPMLFKTNPQIMGTLDSDGLYDLFKEAMDVVSKGVLDGLELQIKESSGFSLEILSSREEWKKELLDMKLDCGFSLHLVKKGGTYDYAIKDLSEDKDRLEDTRDYYFEQALFLNSIFFSGASSAMMFTAERSGIALFSKEISTNRLQGNPSKLPRYPRPISVGLAYAEDRANNMRIKSEFVSIANRIESDILKGKIVTTSEGELRLDEKGRKYNMAVSSSTAKSLADIIFYLRHSAGKMFRLIIDEPEIHLHPDNQLLLSRVFTRMVNRGLQLVVSTHSEYIIRELNNLIMLHYAGESFMEKAEELGYDPEDSLDMSKIQPYLFVRQDNGSVITEAVKVGKDGFAIKSIDDAIAKLNEAAEEIYYAMLENN